MDPATVKTRIDYDRGQRVEWIAQAALSAWRSAAVEQGLSVEDTNDIWYRTEEGDLCAGGVKVGGVWYWVTVRVV